MIEFKDVTGKVIGRPGESFFKMDSISDEAIREYESRGAVIVKMDKVSHAHALKLKTARVLFKAQEALGNVPTEKEMEDPVVTRTRQTRQATANIARKADKLAGEAVTKAKNPPKVGRPKGKNNDQSI